jgi:hypothetical protein
MLTDVATFAMMDNGRFRPVPTNVRGHQALPPPLSTGRRVECEVVLIKAASLYTCVTGCESGSKGLSEMKLFLSISSAYKHLCISSTQTGTQVHNLNSQHGARCKITTF